MGSPSDSRSPSPSADFIGFDVIEGSKLKVLIDDTGRRPTASPGLSADHPRPPFGAAAGRLARELSVREQVNAVNAALRGHYAY
jgi:hypothetical protein